MDWRWIFVKKKNEEDESSKVEGKYRRTGSGREECMFCEQKTHAQCTSTRQHPLEENNTLKCLICVLKVV